jgi:hypothetical protein
MSKLDSEKTIKALFIIESLEYEDEKSSREGRILQQILRLSKEQVRYIYIRTEQELPFALKEFKRSRFRYLHFSCHGSPDTVALTLDQLQFEDFAHEVRPYLRGRRLFFSACSVVNQQLAAVILPGSGCHSLVGPKKDINMDDALMMWATFYHLVFRDGGDKLLGGKIRWALRRMRDTYGIGFEYYRKSDKDPGYLRSDINIR